MSPETYSLARDLAAVLACGAAVKLADDFLDCIIDEKAGRKNWAGRLGAGTMFYAILLLLAAAGLNAAIAVPLFLAAYIVGMFQDFNRIFPSRLTGWQEALLVGAVGAAIFGAAAMLFAVLFMAAVQLADDCLDMARDEAAGYRNLARRLGRMECALLALLCLLGAAYVDGARFGVVFCGAGVFYLILFFWEGW